LKGQGKTMKQYCEICGNDQGLNYYPEKRQTLCASCSKDTPQKVSFDVFIKAYFGNENPGNAIKNEFYSDYLHSDYTLKGYINRECELHPSFI